MILGDKQNTFFVENMNGRINNSREIKLLGIVIYNHLKLKKHIENQCKKASFKLHVLLNTQISNGRESQNSC